MDKDNPNFLHILLTSVKSYVIVIRVWSQCDLGLQSLLFIRGKEQLDGFQQCKGYLYQVMVAARTAKLMVCQSNNELDYFHQIFQPLKYRAIC